MIRIIIFLSLFFSIVPASIAGDINIICPGDGASCTKSGDAFISEADLFPGFTKNPPQVLSVTNQDTDENCNLVFQATTTQLPYSSFLSEKIDLNISQGSTSFYTGSLDSLVNASHSLGSISPLSTTAYSWVFSLPYDAGNEYQNLASSFDLDFNFSCDLVPTPTSTSTSTTTTTTSSTTNDPPTCNDSAPLAPSGFYTQRHSGSVTLYWNHTPSPHTHYLIAYGVQPGINLYGNPNVGDVDHYTVGSLTTGAQYCFYVRSINGCMPGEKTAELCVNAGSEIPASIVPPPGFEPGILGTQTEVTPTPLAVSGEVGGVTNSPCQSFWIPILYFLSFLLNLLFLVSRGRLVANDRSIWRYFLPVLFPALAYFIDHYFLTSRCCLVASVYCRYFWIGNIISFIVPVWYYNKTKQK